MLGRHDRGHHRPAPRRRGGGPRRDPARRRAARQRRRPRDQQPARRDRRPPRATPPRSHARASGEAQPDRRVLSADREDHHAPGADDAASDPRRHASLADARPAPLVRAHEQVSARQRAGAPGGSLKKVPVNTTELGKTTTRPVGVSGSPESSLSLTRTKPISATSPCTYPNGPCRLTRSPTRIPFGATIVK